MSLILDALKRSEQERANNRNNPAVNIELSDTFQYQKKHSRWTILFVFLFLLAMAVIVAVFLTKRPDITETNTISTTPAIERLSKQQPDEEMIQDDSPPAPEISERSEPIPAIQPPLTPPPLHTQTKPRHASPVPLAQQVIKKPPVKKQPVTRPPATRTQDKPSAPQQPAPTEAVNEQSAEPDTTDTPNEDQSAEAAAPALTELPDNDQMMFLNYEINTHFYSSKPGRSFALINMKKYREGQFIDGSQMKIEQITAEGVVVDYGRGTVLLRSY